MANRIEVPSGIGEIVPILQTDDGLNIIEHKELERIMLQRKIACKVESPTILTFPDGGLEVVYQVMLKDEQSGKIVIGIGESNPANLETEIARQYPAKIAYNRAIDHAMIQILDLPGRTYSNTEIQRIKEAPAVNMDTRPAFASTEAEKSSVLEFLSEEPEDISDTLPPEATAQMLQEAAPNAPQQKAAEIAAPAAQEVMQTAAGLSDDTVLLFGNFRGKTLGEARGNKHFPAFLNYIKKNTEMTFPDNERQTQLEQLRAIA